MSRNDTKVLVLDIDGTLTNSEKKITENTKRGSEKPHTGAAAREQPRDSPVIER